MRDTKRWSCARLIAVAVAVIAAAGAGNAPASGQVSAGVVGRVLDLQTDEALPDVLVRLGGTDLQRLTNASGYFALLGLDPGTHRLTFELIGYGNQQADVTLEVGQVLELTVRLAPAAVALEGIRVEVAGAGLGPWLTSRGFAARRADGRGHLHATQQDLRFQSGRNLDDVLRRTEGVRIRRRSDGGSEVFLEPSPRTDGSPCAVGIYLNGAEVEFGEFRWSGVLPTQRALRPLRFDDLLRMDEVDGIELYGPEQSPVASEKYCGALLLWSRMLRPQLDEPLVGDVRGVVVRGESGEPLANAQVQLGPNGSIVTTDHAGRFAFHDLVPGTYEITVQVSGVSEWKSRVEVKAYATTELELAVEEVSGQAGLTSA